MLPVNLTLTDSTLRNGDNALLASLPDGLTTVADPRGTGVSLRFMADKAQARHVVPLGHLTGVTRWTCGHRYEPFWMKAQAGGAARDVPVETQYLLAELDNGHCALFVPLLDGAFRGSLQGATADGHDLELVLESGDGAVVGDEITALFVAVGPNPYALVREAAQAVMDKMQTGRLRRDKPTPRWLDTLGWCTWDAFYQEVSHDKVREGLASFQAGGVQPGLLILDDGWQTVSQLPTGEKQLAAFAANDKFDGTLAPTVDMAKTEFGVHTFLVWHAFHGYWSGVDDDRLPGYGVRNVARDFSPGILSHVPTFNTEWWGRIVGVVSPEQIYRFYQDYHRTLRLQGVDGVKVDNQAMLEGLSQGLGGRVAVMRRWHEALEGSVHTHFQGNLINCMSCASEMIYSALNSNIIRTSTDFWPDRPESHGLHLYVNAQVSLWVGEFVHPDWDMFQSGHPMGAYHAAGRAVSGCSVYVSDKPGKHDFDLLRKLVTPDGRILRCRDIGLPTRDCLFHDPTKEDVLLKIFNRNGFFQDAGWQGKSGHQERGTAGVVGAFHARYNKTDEAEEAGVNPTGGDISGAVRPADIEGILGERFAVYTHYGRELRVLGRDEAWPITLAPLTCEIFTVVTLLEDDAGRTVAPIGLYQMFNSAGAFHTAGWEQAGVFRLDLLCAGPFLAYSSTAPVRVEQDGVSVAFTYDAPTGRLLVDLPPAARAVVRLHFA